MIDFIRDNMAPLMFAGLVIFMVIGYPAAFALAAVGLFFGLGAIELGLIAPNFLGNLTYQLFGVLSNELLLAIPFFTFMGVILEKSGLAEDLLEGFGQLFGGIRGGLSYAVILVGAVLGAITGTVAASVIAMGLISLPIMARYGYNVRHATGVIAASGTITQLIPPSLVLIVLAAQLVGENDQHQRGRDQLRDGARRGNDAGGVAHIVAVAHHHGQRDEAHGEHRSGHHARGRRKQRAHEDDGISQATA